LLSTRARREVGSPRGTLPAHRDQPPDVVARDVVERRRAVSLASGSFASRTRRRPRDISHAPIGLINAINDGAARGWITASFAGTLVTQMQQVIKALPGGSGNAKAKLSQFISYLQYPPTGGITAAYRTIMLNWSNDLLSRM